MGLAARKYSTFKNITIGKVDEVATRYLWTINNRGVNIALEQTPASTGRGFITHTQILVVQLMQAGRRERLSSTLRVLPTIQARMVKRLCQVVLVIQCKNHRSISLMEYTSR